MAYPGCSVREVRDIQYTKDGATLVLDCGHRLWRAGMKHIGVIPVSIQCQQYPCYRPVREMSSDYGT